ncbi:MAG: MarR family winged helix-turn-helix transcriptional regulator [Endozoicomonas sp.]
MKVEQSLMVLERYINRRWRELPGDACSLSYVEYDYLETLGEKGAMRLSDLAEQMRVSKPTASNMVGRLEHKGLVSRHSCPEDGRAVSLVLSPKGQELLDIDRKFYSQLIGELLQGISSEDQSSLEELLTRMVTQTSGR